jgi:hypothetical protein
MSRIRTLKPELFATGIADVSDRAGSWGPTQLYRFYDSEFRLLYIGVTGRLVDRITQHRTKAEWWPLVAYLETEWHQSMYWALEAERAAIADEFPSFNRRSLPR